MEDGKLWAILSYIFPLWLVPLWVLKPRNDYAVFHARQALGLTILAIIVLFVAGFLTWIPIVGWFVVQAIRLAFLVLWIFGIIHAATDKREVLPVVGHEIEKILKNI
ncbi:hypothetical protein GF342_03065 [Candidatus Woesearchaeota archaeon]|nr:hypothetical protein [Candidatus Woesearchaeota archaeon]